MRLLTYNFAPIKVYTKLVKLGWGVTVLVRRVGKRFKVRSYEKDRVHFIEVGLPRKRFLGSKELITFVRELSSYFDLIYFAKLSPPLLDDLPPYHLRLSKPTIYCIHGPLFIRKFSRPTHILYNFTSLIRIPAFKLLRLYDAFRVLNSADYYILKKMGFNAYYLPQGVDTNLFKPNNKYDHFTVLFVGSSFNKGIDLLANMIPRVIKEADDIRFILVDGGFLSHYREYLAKRYPENIVSIPKLPQKDFADMLSRAHILLFPSRYEGSPKTVVEALASGTPVAAFNIPGPADYLVSSPCKLLPPLDLNAMVKEVLHYYFLWEKAPDTYYDIAQRCRSHAKKFDWDNIVTAFHAMLIDTLQRREK